MHKYRKKILFKLDSLTINVQKIDIISKKTLFYSCRCILVKTIIWLKTTVSEKNKITQETIGMVIAYYIGRIKK